MMLSNGPGDPGGEHTSASPQIAKAAGQGAHLRHLPGPSADWRWPLGGNTEKLKYGHRGANQPVQEICQTGRVYITSQNHGYAVVSDSLTGMARDAATSTPTTAPARAWTIQNCAAFTVQFHPEACSGPRDTGFLFDRFYRYDGREWMMPIGSKASTRYWSSAPAPSSSVRPRNLTTPAPRPAGC